MVATARSDGPMIYGMFFVRDRIMCYLVRPICRRMPVWLYASVCRVVAIPYAVKLLLRESWLVRGAAETIGRDSLFDRLKLALEMAWYRLRYLDYYFFERVPHLQVIWPDNEPETERCIFVLANMRGSETITAFIDRYPSIVIRSIFGSEGETSYATARKGFHWWGHLAEVRERATRGRQIATNRSPLQYRRLLNDTRSIVIYQDIWHDREGEPTVRFMGHDVPLKLGAAKLSRMCGNLPVRFVSIRPEGQRWVVRATPRLPPDEIGQRLVACMEAEVLARPGAWEQWEIFLERFKPSRQRPLSQSRAGSSSAGVSLHVSSRF